MLDNDVSLRDPTRQPGRYRHRCFVSIACLSLVVAPGCGFGDAATRSAASVEIIQGKDSAGAIIEPKRRPNRPLTD